MHNYSNYSEKEEVLKNIQNVKLLYSNKIDSKTKEVREKADVRW